MERKRMTRERAIGLMQALTEATRNVYLQTPNDGLWESDMQELMELLDNINKSIHDEDYRGLDDD